MALPQLVKGPYLGDVTALCFARLPQDSAFPTVLAGTGAQVHCYNLETGKQYFSIHVFDGIRVHGIYSMPSTTDSAAEIVAVHGERRVKLFHLIFANNDMSLKLWQAIPRFTKWVLDVRLVKERHSNGTDGMYLAIGLSDNSVCLWDVAVLRVICQVHCSENCLLYSMRLWGDSAHGLQVAAGTIYNEVVVWLLGTEFKLVQDNRDVQVLHSRAEPVQKLFGHEGSIYRIAWSEDGKHLGSVSDDRSARIWKFSEVEDNGATVLFGHTARVWDLHIDGKVFITASEDCTCGVWSLSGELLKTFKGHIGRGVWRCIFDNQTNVLVTAGADASMKFYSLSNLERRDTLPKDMNLIQISFGKCEGQRDSKSEYVRSVNFIGSSSLVVATNNGLLQQINILESGGFDRISLFQTSSASPIVCLDVLQTEADSDVFVACGDGQGNATVLRIDATLDVVWQSTWLAEAERQLLGIFWCKSLNPSFVFTTDPKGGARCWFSVVNDESFCPKLLAYFKTSLCSRIVCMDACLEKQLLVCGDQRGSLFFFHFNESLIDLDQAGSFSELEFFKGAHGVSAVASVSISTGTIEQTRIISTGRDGCVCELIWNSGSDSVLPLVSCCRVEKVAAITVIESVIHRDSNGGGVQRRIAAGFAAAEFVLWDITNEVELKRTVCGGWKRPHSFFFGDFPETQFCFAFVKDQELCVHRIWEDSVNTCKNAVRLQSLQKQSHGREIHSVIFTPTRSDIDWLLTGSEDGTVQITRYSSGNREDLGAFVSLEEHVGGSAVRALALSSDVYHKNGISEIQQILLFSAGAKEVLTCWELSFDSGDQITTRWLSTFNNKTVQKDDLRYLALTVFAVSTSGGIPVYFVVAAMSNAVLTVRAFNYSSKTWHQVALLQHHNTPVLTLHHIVLSHGAQTNRFLVFSGSTDGSVAVWDLTLIVDGFLLKSEEVQLFQLELRPRSGRGSQGGKARYRLRHCQSTAAEEKKNPVFEQNRIDTIEPAVSLVPVIVLSCYHQSGVNALYASTQADASSISIVSGGDDQAIHYTILRYEDTAIAISSSRVYNNAHSSAVKGLWTNGRIVVSTGLDQRLKCWECEGSELIQSNSCVIDVPEAEALHARSLNESSCYRVAVVGRGIQVLKFVDERRSH